MKQDITIELMTSRWVTLGAVRTYMGLRDFLTAGNNQPSMQMIAWWAGVTKPTVWHGLKLLRHYGYVMWSSNGARNRYRLPKEKPPTAELRARIAHLFVGEELYRGPSGATAAEVRTRFVCDRPNPWST